MLSGPLSAGTTLVVILAFQTPFAVEAFPQGSGTCQVTDAGPVFPDTAPHLNGGLGAIDTGAASPFLLRIDNEYVSPAQASTAIQAGVASTITVETAAPGTNDFRGFLFQLTSSDSGGAPLDVSGSFTSPSAETQIMESTGEAVGVPGTCAATNSGATHTNGADKTEGSVTLNVPDQFGGTIQATLSVTVMRNTTAWHHSSYQLAISSSSTGTTPPTNAPAASGTSVPTVTRAPATSVPTVAPGTSVPTVTPGTSAPTVTRAPATSVPTVAPATSVPTVAPATSVPTVTPGTSAPTVTRAPATSAPTVAPATSVPTVIAGTSAPTVTPGTSAPTVTRAPATSVPTVAPATSVPTVTPGTSAPTITAAPATSVPTVTADTSAPTLMPVPQTSAPVPLPLPVITKNPTVMPTVDPTMMPSKMPVKMETNEPTAMPATDEPTAAPVVMTKEPTNTPSATPSDPPSAGNKLMLNGKGVVRMVAATVVGTAAWVMA